MTPKKLRNECTTLQSQIFFRCYRLMNQKLPKFVYTQVHDNTIIVKIARTYISRKLGQVIMRTDTIVIISCK